jgi:hypothetical protein
MKSSREVKEAATLAERERIIKLLCHLEVEGSTEEGYYLSTQELTALIKGENE